jgi:hypothetical protein
MMADRFRSEHSAFDSMEYAPAPPCRNNHRVPAPSRRTIYPARVSERPIRMVCMVSVEVSMGRLDVTMTVPVRRDLLARIARGIRIGPEPQSNAVPHFIRALAWRSDGRYNGQGPFPQTVEELPSVLPVLLWLLLGTCDRLRIVIHAGTS